MQFVKILRCQKLTDFGGDLTLTDYEGDLTLTPKVHSRSKVMLSSERRSHKGSN